MTRIQYVVTIDFEDETEDSAAASELLAAVIDINNSYNVKAEAAYDRTRPLSSICEGAF